MNLNEICNKDHWQTVLTEFGLLPSVVPETIMELPGAVSDKRRKRCDRTRKRSKLEEEECKLGQPQIHTGQQFPQSYWLSGQQNGLYPTLESFYIPSEGASVAVRGCDVSSSVEPSK